MIKNRKMILLLTLLLILFYIAIILFPYIFSNKVYKNTVFLGSNTKVSIKNGDIKIYNDDKRIIKQKAKIYFKNKFIDGYISSGDSESSGVINYYYPYNSYGDKLVPENGLIAHTNDLSIMIQETNKENVKDLTELYNFAKENNIILSDNITLDYLDVNIPKDSENIYIYSVGFIENESDYSSYVFVNNNGKYILVDKVQSDYDDIQNIRLSFYNLIDFNNDGDYEFVISKMMSDYGPNYYELYNFDGSNFTKIGGE